MRVEQSIPLPVGPRAHSPPQFRSVRTVRVPPDGSPRLGVSPRRGPLSPFGSADAAELFARSHPAQAIDFPPLLDEFSRTIATPYGEDLHHGSSSGRIACHLSPLSGMLVGLSVFSFFRAPGAEVWSQEGKCLKWRQKKMPKDSKGLVRKREGAFVEVRSRNMRPWTSWSASSGTSRSFQVSLESCFLDRMRFIPRPRACGRRIVEVGDCR